MKYLNNSSQLSAVFIGDFNEVMWGTEHVSQSRHRLSWPMENFRRIIQDCELVVIGFSCFPFTWCSNYISPFSTRATLDRALASRDWNINFREAKVTHISSNRSDHLLLVLTIGEKNLVISVGHVNA
ncbi:hypothetical protein LIER_33799 [Lithospermum erythrorhizon]|uniref:Reverse transcriptase n=1 Tax=Lithospermum erythrorhizon TaxID=34254 RepID=A0AAV3S2M1_LITER